MDARASRPGRVWLWQALTGVALVFLLGLHFVAQHYVAQGGLRTYAQVVTYLSSPWVFGLEAAFLAVVALHAGLGLRAVALDMGLSPRGQWVVTWAAAVFVVAVVAYGLWLMLRIVTTGG